MAEYLQQLFTLFSWALGIAAKGAAKGTGVLPCFMVLISFAWLHMLRLLLLLLLHSQGVPPAAIPDQLPALLDTSAPFRDAYLAAALGRMQEAVTAAFPGSARVLPSPADVQKCIG